ncbi:MAG: DUF1761 domain-containing protein [Anaplasmataceae bacterium]|nr:DUF1761 domain-containing protein [Anaplasmataceae bacterium]
MLGTDYLAIGVSAVLAMVVGYVWYGPLFGNKWLEVIGATTMDMEKRKEMQKAAGPLYVVQFILTIFQVWVLAMIINVWTNVSGLEIALWVWAAFIIPIVAGGAMWNNDSKKVAWTRFLLQAGYQLVIFVIFGFVLG